MTRGHVRAVLWQHTWQLGHRRGRRPGTDDPNDLVPTAELVEALAHHADLHGHKALREAGQAYVDLWARTFRTLVRHLRGHPRRALHIFCTEVYPYLRGDRLAARVESTQPGRAEVLFSQDLPPDYLAGMLERFVALTRAETRVEHAGGGRFIVAYRLHAAERVASFTYLLTAIRVPLLLTAFIASLVGVCLAGVGSALMVGATLVGALAAQSGANALHDLATPRHEGPLAPVRAGRGWSWFQAVGSYVVAGAALGVLVRAGRPYLLVVAFAGFVLGALYRVGRDRGWGPVIAAVAHGPLAVLGATYSVAGAIPDLSAPLAASAVTGTLAAYMMFLDDLADRPLDEAAGKRTLVVRLRRRRHVGALYALATAVVIAAAAAAWTRPSPGALLLPASSFAGLYIISHSVAKNLDDPHEMAVPRLWALGLFVVAGGFLSLLHLEVL